MSLTAIISTSVSVSVLLIRYRAIFVLTEMDIETWFAVNLMITHRCLCHSVHILTALDDSLKWDIVLSIFATELICSLDHAHD